ncbi:PD40 domain-containing protein [bacterium]|nr:PD40 domain-containing protein [bacterium]
MKNIKFNLLKLCAFVPLCLYIFYSNLCFSSEVQLSISKKSAKKVNLFIEAFVAEGDEHNVELEKAIYADLSRHLKYSGHFSIQKQVSKDTELVSKGSYKAKKGKLVLTAKVYSTSASHEIFAKKYKGLISQSSLLIKTAANDIIEKITGEKSIVFSKIAYTSTDRAGVKQIYVIDYDGKNREQITSGDYNNIEPCWFPDCVKIAYTSYKNGYPGIFTCDLKNHRKKALICYPGVNASSAVSNDGKNITLILSKDGNPELYKVSLPDLLLERLTASRAVESTPTWSNDSQKIAFVSDRKGTPQIYIHYLIDNKTIRLTFEGRYNSDPCWSPVSNKIAYASLTNGHFQIYIANLDVYGVYQLTYEPLQHENPSWAHDGRHIVYSVTKNFRSYLEVMDVITGEKYRLTSPEHNALEPAWSR